MAATPWRIAAIPLFLLLCATILPQRTPDLPEVRDPLLEAKTIEEAPFAKPEITLQEALKLAEGSLKKKVNLRLYFLQEAKLTYRKTDVIEPYWYFRWVRWGVNQNVNIPLEITVSMKRKVSQVER